MSPVEGHQKNRELGHVTNKETLRALVFFSLKNRRLQDDLTVILSYPVGGNREDGARLFLEVHSKNDKRQLIKLQHGKFQVDIRGGGGILHSEGGQPVVAKTHKESPICDDIQNSTGQVAS